MFPSRPPAPLPAGQCNAGRGASSEQGLPARSTFRKAPVAPARCAALGCTCIQPALPWPGLPCPGLPWPGLPCPALAAASCFQRPLRIALKGDSLQCYQLTNVLAAPSRG